MTANKTNKPADKSKKKDKTIDYSEFLLAIIIKCVMK